MIEQATDSKFDIAAIVARHKDMVFSIALAHTCSKSDAEDVFQDAFLVCQQKQPQFNDFDHERAWLINTTLNCSKKQTMSSWSQKVVPINDLESVSPVDPFLFETDEQSEIFYCLQRLPEKYRSVLHLYYFADLSIIQIANTLDIAPTTVKVQLSRARALMREQLKGEYFDE